MIELKIDSTKNELSLTHDVCCNEHLADEEIAQAGRAVQMFEIEIEHLSGKEVQEK